MKHRILNAEHRANRLLVRSLFGAVACAIFFSALAADTPPAKDSNSPPSFDSFSIISTRNIFDPNRRAFRPYQQRTRERSPDSFALVGTMSYSKGKFAFFDSGRAEYKKVLEPGATIAGYIIKDVTPKNITLLGTNGNEIAMNVGNQMLNEGRDGWKLSTEAYAPSTSTSDQNPDTDANLTLPASANPAANDVLKRLMEQRQQEMKQDSQ